LSWNETTEIYYTLTRLVIKTGRKMLMSKIEWVEIYSAVNQIEAEIIKGFLEAQGLMVYLSQEGYQKAMGISGPAGAYIEVMVPNYQEDQAKELLIDYSTEN